MMPQGLIKNMQVLRLQDHAYFTAQATGGRSRGIIDNGADIRTAVNNVELI